jgi:hypothetical protein
MASNGNKKAEEAPEENSLEKRIYWIFKSCMKYNDYIVLGLNMELVIMSYFFS